MSPAAIAETLHSAICLRKGYTIKTLNKYFKLFLPNITILMRKSAIPRKRKKSNRSAANANQRRHLEPTIPFPYNWLLLFIEVFGLTAAAVTSIMILLGYLASWFTGTDFFSNALPFALALLSLIITGALLVLAWWKLRHWLNAFIPQLASALSLSLAVVIGWTAMQNVFSQPLSQFQKMVGGSQHAMRVTLTHQIYAKYRRTNLNQLNIMFERAEKFSASIEEAADTFNIDPALLHGIAAAESSFIPRDSPDGGRGLFQITQAPSTAMHAASQFLATKRPDLRNAKHNAFVAAATFQYYLKVMNDDLFLGLLAYNIGPANGGLQFIMQRYGATDFVSIQPYLQELPREYPIRVLTYALAYRIWQKEGMLQAYEKGDNALNIQKIGIPQLSDGKLLANWFAIFKHD